MSKDFEFRKYRVTYTAEHERIITALDIKAAEVQAVKLVEMAKGRLMSIYEVSPDDPTPISVAAPKPRAVA